MRRRTLVDLLQRGIRTGDDRGPDWVTAVEDAVLRQDMGWVIEAQPVLVQVPHRTDEKS